MENENTKYENIVACLNENITTVRAKFINKNSNDKSYLYKIDKKLAESLIVEDVVVAEYGDSGNLHILEVTEIHEKSEIMPDSDTSYKWIVSKVDMDNLNSNKEFEALNVEALKQKRRAEVRNRFLEEQGLDKIKLIELDK